MLFRRQPKGYESYFLTYMYMHVSQYMYLISTSHDYFYLVLKSHGVSKEEILTVSTY